MISNQSQQSTDICNAEGEFSVLWVQHTILLAGLHVVQRNLALLRSTDHVLVARRKCHGPQIDWPQGYLIQQLARLCFPKSQRRVQRAAGDGWKVVENGLGVMARYT